MPVALWIDATAVGGTLGLSQKSKTYASAELNHKLLTSDNQPHSIVPSTYLDPNKQHVQLKVCQYYCPIQILSSKQPAMKPERDR